MLNPSRKLGEGYEQDETDRQNRLTSAYHGVARSRFSSGVISEFVELCVGSPGDRAEYVRGKNHGDSSSIGTRFDRALGSYSGSGGRGDE